VPPEVWLDFAEAEKARDEKDVGFAAWLLGGIIALILLLVLWSPIGLFGGALPISIGAGAGAAALGWLFYRIVANANYRWRRSQRAVEIWIRPDGMRINRRIVYWNQSNAVLTAARVEKPVEATRYGILEVSVRVTGHHPSPITHHPSPITHHPSPITHHPSASRPRAGRRSLSSCRDGRQTQRSVIAVQTKCRTGKIGCTPPTPVRWRLGSGRAESKIAAIS
jgi:hypothetical protein